ncbi:unnamed protein product [Psylliodes chrysocephalus]|uniref:C2H2-type domain-containing protein n=1 Tax=Psylliodes chrysocephalus TaxID=3402493 RepID=A0A9P0D7X4_9CUCU|nr:unnamed protein product [Psylliodes chrysocephala]
MFEFRERAVKTDKYLKDQCKNANQNHEITDTEHPSVIPIKSKNTTQIVSPINNENEVPNKAATHEINPSLITPEKSKPVETLLTDTTPEFSKKKAKKRVHWSIEEIFAKHSEIKLPSSCLRLDVSPSVNLEMDFVEEYFRQNKQDIKKYVQHALRSNRASKKTLQVKQKKPIKANNSSVEDNKRIVEENTPGVIKHPDHFKVRLSNIPQSQKCTGSEDNDDDYGIVKSFKQSKRRRISDSSTEAESMKQPTIMELPTLMENAMEQPTLMENAMEQPTLMETLQLKPKENAFVHRCTICNSLQRSAKALREHYQTHLKCTYCKKRFKLLNRKEVHDTNCAIKFCLTRPVYVKLEKIDATKYLSEDIEPVPVQSFEKTDAIAIQVNNPKNAKKFTDEIIELSDDDTDPNPPTPSPLVATCTSKSTDLPATLNTIPLNIELPKLIPITPPSNTIIEQSQCTGTSIVKPFVDIKDNSVLNTIDTSLPDNKVLKQLLSSSKLNNLKLLIEDETQTNIPSNDEVRYSNQVAEFKNLFPQLYAYKIPISVKKGEFKVSYQKTQKSAPNNKKSLAHWSHTKPVDIKSTNNAIFNIENFNKHISLDIPLFNLSNQKSQPTILNHTVISQNLPQIVPTTAAPRLKTYQPAQNSNFPVIHQPAPTQIRQIQSVPRVQTQSKNFLVYSLPQQAQTQLSNVQASNMLQVQTQTSNIQAHSLPQQVQTQTSNIQVRSLPQRIQTQTSNIQTHNLPQQIQTTSNTPISLTRQIQSNIQSLTAPQEMPTVSVQNHVLQQTLQYQIQNVPHQTSSNTIPISSSMFTINPNLQNIQQTPVYNADVQNLNNYFLNSNNNTVIAPVTNSTSSLNSTITNNIQGPINTNENTFSRGDIQSNPQNYDLNSKILNIPASVTPVSLTNTAASTSSHLLVRNNSTSTITNFMENTSYQSSTSKTAPPPNVNPFSKTAVGTISGINTFASTSTESQRNSTTSNVESNKEVHKPMIRILQNDIISQKICSNCFKLTGKMFEFRERAVKTDKYLKDQCKNANQNHEITDTEYPSVIPIKSKNTTQIVSPINNENEVPNKAATHEINPSLITPEKSKPAETLLTDTTPEFSKKKAKKRVHWSIEEIFAKHSEIKLPSSCLRLDVSPSVNLEMDFVEEYFRQNKQDIKKYVQHALRSNRASKKTLQVKQKKPIKANNSSVEDNKRIVEENTPGVIKHPDHFKVRLSNIPQSQKCTGSEDNDDDYGIVKSFKQSKRRRISDSSTEAEPMKQPTIMELPTLMENAMEQPTLMETLQLKPKENAFVHRCTICNSLQRSAKALREHYKTHLKCTYCKKRFKLLNRKEVHDTNCAIKFCLTRPVYVKLEKIDATKYLSEDIEPVPVQSFEKTDAIAIQVNNPKNAKKFTDEIIELSDDDTDPNPPTPSPLVATCTSKSTDLPATLNTIPLNIELPKLIPITPPSNTIIEQSQCTGTSIVKPFVDIKDNSVLNTIDTSLPDNKVLKQLLSSSKLNNLKLLIEDETQTNIPSNDEVRYSNQVAEFKNLFPQLYAYKIPISVKKGEFKVSYQKTQKSAPNNKKSLAHWSHTKPVDVKSTNNAIFNIENFNKHISLDIPLFNLSNQKSQPTILNHTVISQNLPQIVPTTAAPRLKTYQPAQNSNFPVIHQPAPTQIRQIQSVPRVQTQSKNFLVYSLPQQAQTQLSNVQASNMLQVQTQTSNIQAHSLPQQVQTQTSNIQVRSLPQRIQTQTSNIQTHNLPQQIQTTSNTPISLTRQSQSNLQSLSAPQEMPAVSVQNHVLQQTLQYQIQNVPHQTSSNTIPISSSMFTINPNLQNIQQTPVYNADVQNLNNYFLNSNNNTVIAPVTNSTSSLNSTITNNIQGPINTNENTFSRGDIQSNPQNYDLNSKILNIPASVTPVSLTNTAASTSSHLLVRNNSTSTITNFMENTSYQSSTSKTAPPPNVNPFSKTAGGTISGINTFASTSTESQRNSTTSNVESNKDVHKPMIRVRNIFELT